MAANRFLDIHGGQVAGEHGGGAEVGFAIGKDGKLYRDAACFKHSPSYPVGQLSKMGITGCQFRPGVADANDGTPLKMMLGDRSEEHTSELQSRAKLVCRLLL